jgi:hypothetical protein
MNRSHLTTLLLAVAAALTLAASATAGGEPKNVGPFTRVVAPTQRAAPSGDAKNMAPFTRPTGRVPYVPDWFERYVEAHPYGQGTVTAVVTTESHAFSWYDTLLGAATTAALALMIAALAVTRRSRFRHALGA